jgi:putative DNA methylase
VLLEDIPRYGPQLGEELRRVGAEIKAQAERELADLYLRDPDGATPIAYLWARTVRCEAPHCGAEIPLVRSFWLCKKANRKRALRYKVENGRPPRVEFEVFEPKTEKDVPAGTVARAKARCLACGAVLPPERVRVQLAAQRGGADVAFDERGRRTGGARLLAVVTLKPGEQGRHYRLPTERDYEAVGRAQKRLAVILDEWGCGGKHGLCPVPDEPLPLMSGTFNVPLYGMNRWGDLFTARQKVALVTLARAVRELPASVPEAVRLAMALVVNRCADYNSANCRWVSRGEFIGNTFTRQALPIVWDFAEVDPASNATGGFTGALDWVAKVIEAWPGSATGQVQVADATEHPLPDETVQVWFTDPPYYFAVPYADLSDFFFVWLKRAMPGHPLSRDPFDAANPLTPKARELCEMAHWDPERYAHKNQAFFEEGMARAFREGRRVLQDDGIGAVVFAHKTTEGWEALLSGLIRAGWTVTASWPITTEMGSRLRARESAALAASVHLVLRPRPKESGVGDWDEVLRELPGRVGDWMQRLQAEGIRGADLVFACIGPALEIFSRYSRVETAEGREVTLAEFLEKVWEVVGRAALRQVLGTADGAGALEEDARLVALFLWTLQSTNGNAAQAEAAEEEDEAEVAEDEEEEEERPRKAPGGYALVYDVVRRFAQPLGIRLPDWEGRVIEAKKGVVRLLTIRERARVLFGREGADLVARRIERAPRGPVQLELLLADRVAEAGAEYGPARRRGTRGSRGSGSDRLPEGEHGIPRGATTLDRVHAAMLLQAAGRANALRALLRSEVERGPDFLRLANALAALYPKGSEERRLVEAMLLAVPR